MTSTLDCNNIKLYSAKKILMSQAYTQIFQKKTFSITTLSITTLSIKTLSITTFSKMTFSIKGSFVTLSINDTQHKILYF
jgi:hypothetical protein